MNKQKHKEHQHPTISKLLHEKQQTKENHLQHNESNT
jgi:hypothetical protein